MTFMASKGIDLRGVASRGFFWSQRGVHILAVGDGRLGDAALTATRTLRRRWRDPFVVGRKRTKFSRRPVRRLIAIGLLASTYWGFRSYPPYWQMPSRCTSRLLCQAGGRVIDQRAFHSDRNELIRLATSAVANETFCHVIDGRLFTRTGAE